MVPEGDVVSPGDTLLLSGMSSSVMPTGQCVVKMR